MNRVLVLLVSLSACSSIVSDPCAHGFMWDGERCTTVTAGVMMTPDFEAPDAGPGLETLPVDPLVCALPTTRCGTDCVLLDSDPYNCGHCGRVCPSGICSAGHCVGDLAGHIVAIGHDYATADGAMDRVLANALGMGGEMTVQVGWWRGTATQESAIVAASRGLAQTSRMATATSLTGDITTASLEGLDAIVIEPQVGDGGDAEAAGGRASAALAAFLTDGHVVVVLETVGGVSYRYATGANLFTVPAPVDATGTQVTVVAPADEVAQGVVSPYLAKTASVGYTGVVGPVVVDGAGDAVVFHAIW